MKLQLSIIISASARKINVNDIQRKRYEHQQKLDISLI